MPSLFARLGRVAGRTVDGVYGETFLLTPRDAPVGPSGRRDVNASATLSERLPSFPITAVFVAAGALMHARGRAMADSATHTIAAERPLIDVAQADLMARPQRDWIVERLETGERFTVADVVPVDFGRLQIHLTEIRDAR